MPRRRQRAPAPPGPANSARFASPVSGSWKRLERQLTLERLALADVPRREDEPGTSGTSSMLATSTSASRSTLRAQQAPFHLVRRTRRRGHLRDEGQARRHVLRMQQLGERHAGERVALQPQDLGHGGRDVSNAPIDVGERHDVRRVLDEGAEPSLRALRGARREERRVLASGQGEPEEHQHDQESRRWNVLFHLREVFPGCDRRDHERDPDRDVGKLLQGQDLSANVLGDG